MEYFGIWNSSNAYVIYIFLQKKTRLPNSQWRAFRREREVLRSRTTTVVFFRNLTKILIFMHWLLIMAWHGCNQSLEIFRNDIYVPFLGPFRYNLLRSPVSWCCIKICFILVLLLNMTFYGNQYFMTCKTSSKKEWFLAKLQWRHRTRLWTFSLASLRGHGCQKWFFLFTPFIETELCNKSVLAISIGLRLTNLKINN